MLTLTLTVNRFSVSTNADADANVHCEWALMMFKQGYETWIIEQF